MELVQSRVIALLAASLKLYQQVMKDRNDFDGMLIAELWDSAREGKFNAAAVEKGFDRLAEFSNGAPLNPRSAMFKVDLRLIFRDSLSRLKALQEAQPQPELSLHQRISLWCADLAGAMLFAGFDMMSPASLIPICMCTMGDFQNNAKDSPVTIFGRDEAELMLGAAREAILQDSLPWVVVKYCAECVPAE